MKNESPFEAECPFCECDVPITGFGIQQCQYCGAYAVMRVDFYETLEEAENAD